MPSSAPSGSTPASRPKNEPDFSQFIMEVREKWINALSLTLASRLGRHRQAEGIIAGAP